MLYLATMRPGIDFWDTGEMQTVPWILGIAHPTGFPAFVLGGFAFAHLVPTGTVAWRLTLFSAVAMATAAWALFAAAREVRLAPLTALFAPWTFAATPLAWTRGTRTEVHALAIATSAVALWIGLRFLRTRDLRLLPWGALALSVSLGVHPVAIFLVPLMLAWAAIGIFTRQRVTLESQTPAVKTASLVIATIGAALVGPLLYCYMPLRSAWLTHVEADPTLALGIPPGRPYWDYGHTATLSGFHAELTGSAFSVDGGLSGIFSPAAYAKIPAVFFADLNSALGHHAVLIVLAVGALALAARIGKLATAALLVFGFLAVPFATSYTSESDVPRYFLAAYWIATLLLATGLEALISLAARGVWIVAPRMQRWVRYARIALPATALLLIAFANIQANWPQMQLQHHDTTARDFINRVRSVTPSNAIIVSFWTYATPLAYAAYVDRDMQQRIVETAWPADDVSYFPAWFHKRPIVLVSIDGRVPPSVTSVKVLDGGYPQLLLVTRLQ